jgi:hypothetical protein
MTIRINVDMRDAGRIEKRLAQMWRGEMTKAMRKAASMCKPVLIARTADAPPAYPESPRSRPGAIDQGKIINNWEFLFDPGSLKVMIFNKTDHAGYAEVGVPANARKIGPLGRDMIESWMLRKGIVINDKDTSLPLSSKKAAKLLVFSINRRNQKWRFHPRTMVLRSVPRIMEIFNREIAAQRERMIEKAAREVATRRSR